MVTKSSKSLNVPLLVAATFSAALTAPLLTATAGATSVNDTPNDVVDVPPSMLVAVIVTVYGVSSSPVPDQLHVPFWLPLCVYAPVVAFTVTASSKSLKLPLLVAAAFSAALTEALLADTVGATSVNDTPNDVVDEPPSAFVAVIVTV